VTYILCCFLNVYLPESQQQKYHLEFQVSQLKVTGAPPPIEAQQFFSLSSTSIACDAFEVHCLAGYLDLLVFLNARRLISCPQRMFANMSDANLFGMLGKTYKAGVPQL
jgi:hypothetical protein